MKLRQKLAMVLATAMVVTAVPVVTFAASKNTTTHVAKVTEGTTLSGNVAPDLKIKLEDGITTTSPIYINIENASWKDEDGNALIATGNLKATNKNGADLTGFQVVSVSDKELVVQYVNASQDDAAAINATKGAELVIPMLTEVTGGEAKAHITGSKWVTETPEAGITFATTTAGTAKLTVGTVPSFYTEGGRVASITLDENTIGALKATAKNGNVEITLGFDAGDFEIDTNKTVSVALERGFKGKTVATSNVKVSKDEITLTIPAADLQADETGRIVVSNVYMKTTDRTPSLGDITVDVINAAFQNQEAVVAHVAEYGVALTAKDDKIVEMVSGNQADVQFTLAEKVDATIANGRKIQFTLDQGYFVRDSIQVSQREIARAGKLEITEIKDKKGNITGFEFEANTEDVKLDSFDIKAKVVLPMEKEGEITVKATGRALGEEKELVIAKATPAVKLEATQFAVNAGVKDQKGGKLVITETDKEMLQKGNIEFYLPLEDGITFTAAPAVEVVKGDLKVETKDLKVEKVYTDADGKEVDANTKDAKLAGYKVVVPVTRQSREASTIEVTGFEVKLDRNVPSGKYDLTVKGSAIGATGELKQESFFNVGIKDENAGEKVTTTIVNGATEMVVNGEKVAMPTAAYIKNGKLMAPLRVVANAFGFDNSAINYNSATKEILIRGNGSVIKLTIGSKQAYVDGTPITLAVPAEIKAESTFVPVGDLGRLLGIKVEWDNATKTATFSN